MVVCGKCGETDESKFYPSVLKGRPGRGTKGCWCTACHRAYYRAQVAEDKDYFLKYARRRLRRTKAILRQERVERGCERCGEKHPACLDFHHRDEKDKRFNISLAVSRGKKTVDQLRAEIDKCIVLCANCHRKLHYDEQSGVFSSPPAHTTRGKIPY